MAQVITTPFLRCVVENVTNSANTLTWDAATNNPCGAFAYYIIYKSPSAAGPFVRDTVITDQNATTWVDNSINGSAAWYYYVADSFACPAATYIIPDTVQNEANPRTPGITGVSVNADGTVTFTWLPSSSPQTRYYIIYLVQPNGNHSPLDTVYGRFNTSWTDSTNDPTATTLSYTVAAGDSCAGNQLSAYNTRPQQTVLLSYSAARCNPAIPLAWTPYINMPGGLGGYEIFVSRNDSAFTEVASLDSATLAYSFLDFDNGDSLQIYVMAFSKSDTTHKSSSNYIRFIATVIKPPAFIYITNLTVDTTNNSVDVNWIVDNNAKMLDYQVRNSEDGTAYHSLTDRPQGVQQVPVPVARFASYADSTVQPQYGPYWYEVQGDDSCFSNRITPHPAEIISLQGTLSDYYQISLTWNHFQLYNANVIRYDLYRDYGLGMQFIHSFDSTATSYIDSVFQFLSVPGEFCYVIKGVYYINLPDAGYTKIDTTFSNIACIDHRPIIYIPNAFVWNGVNNFFKPRIIFGDPAGYDMTIWDRYGGKIFETHDVNGYWDGTRDGQPVDQGGYAYLIKFTALDGTPVERKGIVLFIKK
jgi:hypothetical protein